MRDAPPELGRIVFHLDQGSAKRRLFLSLRQRLLEQAAKTTLLALDPQEILAGNLRIQKRAAQDLSSRESRRLGKGIETGNMFIPNPHTDEMPKPPHE